MKVADIEAVLKKYGDRLLKDSDPELFKAELEGGPSTLFLSRTSQPSEPKASPSTLTSGNDETGQQTDS